MRCCVGAGAGLFTTVSGECTVVSDGTCFRSPNYPSNYDNNQRCTITVAAHEQVMLSVVAFDTESGYDYLTVNSVRYMGTSGPHGVSVAPGASITFYTDGSVTRSGFEICGAFLTNPTAAIVTDHWCPTEVGDGSLTIHVWSADTMLGGVCVHTQVSCPR